MRPLSLDSRPSEGDGDRTGPYRTGQESRSNEISAFYRSRSLRPRCAGSRENLLRVMRDSYLPVLTDEPARLPSLPPVDIDSGVVMSRHHVDENQKRFLRPSSICEMT